jgi:FkbM family methyltransferase
MSPEAAFKTAAEFPARVRLLRWLGKHVWLPKGHDALLRATYDPDSGQRFLFEIDFFGLRYRGDLGQYIDWQVFCYGGAPLCELHLLRDLVGFLRSGQRRKIRFYDVGANIGHHSLFMSPLVDDVYAFEPFKELVGQIEDKIKLNGLTNIHILPFALGGEDTKIAYYPGPDSNSGVGSLIQEFPGVRNESVMVELRNGDRLLAREGLPKIDILKLDVQGYEPNVLRGLAGRIHADRPIVLAELSDQSRRGFGDCSDFSRVFYEGALFVEVTGRQGRSYELKAFNYATSEEVLILPPELSTFLERKL